jgi:hypothetical protein
MGGGGGVTFGIYRKPTATDTLKKKKNKKLLLLLLSSKCYEDKILKKMRHEKRCTKTTRKQNNGLYLHILGM